MATQEEASVERELSLDEELRPLLAAIRHARGGDPTARIARGRLRRAEVTLDETFPEDLIAAWAVFDEGERKTKAPETVFSPEGAVVATAHIGDMGYEDAAEGYVALCRLAEEGHYACWANASSSPIKVRRREDPDTGAGVRVIVMEFSKDLPARVLGKSMPLSRFVRQRQGLEPAAVEAVPASFAEAFRVVVLEPPTAKIRHAKFGEGELVEDLGDRAVVRFSDGKTRKLLKTSFVV